MLSDETTLSVSVGYRNIYFCLNWNILLLMKKKNKAFFFPLCGLRWTHIYVLNTRLFPNTAFQFIADLMKRNQEEVLLMVPEIS